MRKIPGMQLTCFPVSGLSRIRDLIYFDGPLLTEYSHPSGDRFLFYWCDCDDKSDRWMILRISESSVLRLENKLLSLDEVIPRAAQDDYVYFADIHDGKEWKNKPVILTSKSKVPAEYVPKPGAQLTGRQQDTAEKTYPIMIEGGWSVPDLGDFPKKFSQSYALLYCLNTRNRRQFRRLPWRGGFSAMHFFNRALDSIPAADRPRVASMQYRSPGFMRFELDIEIAKQVTLCVADMEENRKSLHRSFVDLESYIRKHDLNDLAESAQTWPKHDRFLTEKTKDLLSCFQAIDSDDIFAAVRRIFEATKIAMAFYRRVRDLDNFQRSGQVIFPLQ